MVRISEINSQNRPDSNFTHNRRRTTNSISADGLLLKKPASVTACRTAFSTNCSGGHPSMAPVGLGWGRYENKKVPISRPAANAQSPRVQADTMRTRLRRSASCAISRDRSVMQPPPAATASRYGKIGILPKGRARDRSPLWCPKEGKNCYKISRFCQFGRWETA
jgi:hypothetical protein